MVKKSKKSGKKEEVCEVFDIGKKDKEEEKTSCDLIDKKQATKEQIQHQNKLLRNILIGLGIVILLLVLGVYFFNSLKSFEYRGVKWNIVEEGELIFYKTYFLVNIGIKKIPYNFYLRNDHRKLDKEIPFEGEMFKDNELAVADDRMARLVYNMSEFDCDSDERIAIGNLINLQGIGIKLFRDANISTTCDPKGRYIFINIKEAETSGIKQIGKACYELDVADCEILKVTERFMTEIFVRYNE